MWKQIIIIGVSFIILMIVQLALYIHKTITNRKANIANYYAFMKANPTANHHANLLTTRDNKTNNKLSVSIVLGSGGHTSEVLSVTRHLPRSNLANINYFYANTDQGSKLRATAQEMELKMFYPESTCKINYTNIPRAREVGQSYVTAVFTTLWSIFMTIFAVLSHKQHILIVNGPGSCVPVCLVTIFFNAIGLSDTTIVFIESLTRVKSLSLSGKILYYLVDRFVVHWPQLQQNHPLVEYLGIIY